MHNNRFMKRLYKPKDFFRLLTDLVSSAGSTRGLSDDEKISNKFMERIMLAVTEVNGCRYCSYFHSRVSLKAGLKKEEITRALDGDFVDAPQEELAALYFAQYYAESEGKPDLEAVKCLFNNYGDRKTKAIFAYIRAIMIGNAWGNMFDSIRNRIKGSPTAGISLWDEMGVILGPILFLPIIFIATGFKKLSLVFSGIQKEPI